MSKFADGFRVFALVHKVRGPAYAKQQFPDHWETATVEGVVVGRDPASARSLLVKWDGDDVSIKVATRHLTALDGGGGAAAAAGGAAGGGASPGAHGAAAPSPAGGRGRGRGRGRGGRGLGEGGGFGREAELELADADSNFTDDELEELREGAIDPADEAAGAEPGADDLAPHGLKWTVAEASLEADGVSSRKASVKWRDYDLGDKRTPIDYFRHFYPVRHVPEMLEATNAVLAEKEKSPLTEQEFFVYVGLLLLMTFYPTFPVAVLFGVAGGVFSIHPQVLGPPQDAGVHVVLPVQAAGRQPHVRHNTTGGRAGALRVLEGAAAGERVQQEPQGRLCGKLQGGGGRVDV
jgi:hypothetical protein